MVSVGGGTSSNAADIPVAGVSASAIATRTVAFIPLIAFLPLA